MESLPLPCRRQNMNTVPFVNQPRLCNQVHMCLYVCVCAHAHVRECVRRALACWQRKQNVTRYVCVHMFVGGNGRVNNPTQYLVSVYLFKCAVVFKWAAAHAEMCVSALVEGEECPGRVQLSKHVPSAVSPLPSWRNNLA